MLSASRATLAPFYYARRCRIERRSANFGSRSVGGDLAPSEKAAALAESRCNYDILSLFME